MGYKFRLSFLLPEDSSFIGDEESTEVLARNSESLKLVARDKEKGLGSSNRFDLIGGRYVTFEEAKEAGEAAHVALLYYATTNCVGINFGEYVLAGELTKAGDDRLGLTVFEGEPTYRLVGLPVSLEVGRSTQAFVKTMQDAFRRYALTSPRAEIATELFTASFFENPPRARFLFLYMSFEVLLEPLPRSPEAQELVSEMMEIARNAEIPKEDRESLLSALGGLKKESIRKTGGKLADGLLSGSLYDSLSPEEFFDKINRIRNDLVHQGEVDLNELVDIVPELEGFVGDILRHHFKEN